MGSAPQSKLDTMGTPLPNDWRSALHPDVLKPPVVVDAVEVHRYVPDLRRPAPRGAAVVDDEPKGAAMAIGTFATVASAAKDTASTLKELGVLEAVRNKLVRNPDKAAKHLVDVLQAIEGVYADLQKQILEFSSLGFSGAELERTRMYLRDLKTGGLEVKIQEANNACRKIKTIYQRYLNPWFQRALNRKEQAALSDLFTTMSIVDNKLVDEMEHLSKALRGAGSKLLLSLDSSQGPAKAKKHIASIESQMDHALQSLTTGLVQLKKLQGDFASESNASLPKLEALS